MARRIGAGARRMPDPLLWVGLGRCDGDGDPLMLEAPGRPAVFAARIWPRVWRRPDGTWGFAGGCRTGVRTELLYAMTAGWWAMESPRRAREIISNRRKANR